MNGQELVDSIKVDIHQDGDAGFFTDANLLAFVNEGYVDWCRHTQMRQKQTTQTITALDALISLPSDFIEAQQLRLTQGTTVRQLYAKDERQLDYDERDWPFQTGIPENYVYFNYNVSRLKPIPTSAGTLTLRYAYIPADITLTSSPDIPEVYQNALVDYGDAMAFIAMREYENAGIAWGNYLNRRKQGAMQSRDDQRTPDTLPTQRPVNVFTYGLWDQGYRTR